MNSLSCVALLLAGLVWSCGQRAEKPKGEKVTFAEHIAPIIHRNCTKCHRAKEAGPFELITWSDVARRGRLVKYVTAQRIMPPWPADASYSHFAGETVLSDDEIALIGQWVDSGMAAGDTASLKVPVTFTAEPDLGRPDLVLPVPHIPIKGNNTDLFTVVKVPYEIPRDTFVRAVEFVCGNKKLVHHMNGHLVQFDPMKKKNVREGRSWVDQDQTRSQEIHRELGLLHDDGTYPTLTPSVSNYLPGSRFSFYPSAIGGYRLSRKGALYLNDLHFGPSPVDTVDSSYFRIYYSARPPVRPVSEFQMGTLGIAPVEPPLVVPAGEVKTFHIKASVPADISVISIVPHMHLIGKSYLAFAVTPTGDTIPLIRIPRWDFRWQYFYQVPRLLRIPRGSVIYVEGVYDNTASNPNNPFSPPREIRERNGSMRTTDEMFQLIITYVPYQPGDEQISQE